MKVAELIMSSVDQMQRLVNIIGSCRELYSLSYPYVVNIVC